MDDGERHSSDAACQRAALLLPGLCTPAEVMRPLKRRLERSLGCEARIVSLGAACGDIRDLAERAHALLDDVAPGARVDVVGHSMGGLVAAYLLKCLDRGRRVRRVVTLGTPHQGLAICRAGYLLPGPVGRTLRQLMPGSSLIGLLSRLPLPEGCELVSIAGLLDGVVTRSATRLPELAGQRNLDVPADHLGLVFSARAAEALVGVLCEGEPEAAASTARLRARATRAPRRTPASRAARAVGGGPAPVALVTDGGRPAPKSDAARADGRAVASASRS